MTLARRAAPGPRAGRGRDVRHGCAVVAFVCDAVTPVMGHARCNVSIASRYREGTEIREINPKEQSTAARRLRQAPYRLMLLMTVRGVSARETKCVFPVRHSRTPFRLRSLRARSEVCVSSETFSRRTPSSAFTPYREEPDLRACLRAGPPRVGMQGFRASRGLRIPSMMRGIQRGFYTTCSTPWVRLYIIFSVPLSKNSMTSVLSDKLIAAAVQQTDSSTRNRPHIALSDMRILGDGSIFRNNGPLDCTALATTR